MGSGQDPDEVLAESIGNVPCGRGHWFAFHPGLRDTRCTSLLEGLNTKTPVKGVFFACVTVQRKYASVLLESRNRRTVSSKLALSLANDLCEILYDYRGRRRRAVEPAHVDAEDHDTDKIAVVSRYVWRT